MMTKNNNKQPSQRQQMYQTYLKTSAVGLEAGLSIVVGIVLGFFADKYLMSSPYGMIIGLTLGILAAAKSLYTFSKKYLKQENKKD